MNTIYLLSPDGHRNSVSYDWFAVDELGIKQMVYSYRKEYLGEEVDIHSFEIDLAKLFVNFKSKPEWEDEWEEYTYYLLKINKI
jgi:hypothetical protein